MVCLADNEKEFLSVKDVAEMCGISYGTVKRDIDRGKLAAYRIGRKFFVHFDDCRDYFDSHMALKAIEGYTVKDIMKKIPVSYAFVMEMIKQGILPAVKVGREYIITFDDFAVFMEKQKL